MMQRLLSQMATRAIVTRYTSRTISNRTSQAAKRRFCSKVTEQETLKLHRQKLDNDRVKAGNQLLGRADTVLLFFQIFLGVKVVESVITTRSKYRTDSDSWNLANKRQRIASYKADFEIRRLEKELFFKKDQSTETDSLSEEEPRTSTLNSSKL